MMTCLAQMSINLVLLPVALILPLLLAVLVVGLVVLAVRGGRTGRIVAGAFASLLIGVPLLMAGFAFVTLKVRSAEMRAVEAAYAEEPSAAASFDAGPAPVAPAAPVAPFGAATASPPPSAAAQLTAVTTPTDAAGSSPPLESATRWRPAADLLPDAAVDLYPSQREAEDAVAAALVRGYTTGKPIRITLIDKRVQDAEQTHRGLARAIRRRGAACDFNDTVRGSSSLHELAYVNVAYTPPTDRFPLGALTASVPGRSEIRARFVAKEWLTDLSAQRELRGQPDLLVGVGPELATTEADALTAALRSVALQVAPRLADARPPGTYDPKIRYVVLDSVVRRLRQIDRLDDRFVQRLERSYGTVYRAAVLVNATPEFIDELYGGNQHAWTDLPPGQQYAAAAATAPTAPAARHASVTARGPASNFATALTRVAGLGLLTVLTLLIYLALDRWTRGYRPVLLSTGAIIAILGGAALLGLLSLA